MGSTSSYVPPPRPKTSQPCCPNPEEQVYISGNAVVILDGPQNLLQTIYLDNEDDLQAVAFDEDSGKIAAASRTEVHIYRPGGKAEGVLRVRDRPARARTKLMHRSGRSNATSPSTNRKAPCRRCPGDRTRGCWSEVTG